MDSQPLPQELELSDQTNDSMRFKGKPPGSRARVIDNPIELFSEPSPESPVVVVVPVGCEVALGPIKKINGTKWFETVIPSGHKGYFNGAHRVLLIQKVILVDKSVNVYEEPTTKSQVAALYKKDTEFFIVDIIRQVDGDWYKIRDRSGREGFIEKKTKVFCVDPNPQNLPIPAEQESNLITHDQKKYEWFFEIEDTAGDKFIYGLNETNLLVEEISKGKYQKDNSVISHVRASDGQWTQTKFTLIELARRYFELRKLYEPVKAYAVKGSQWGFRIGITLTILIFFLRFNRDSHLGLATFLLTENIIPAILVVLTGGLIGYLFGMAVGGIIGMNKKETIQLAKDAVPEPEDVLLKVVFLPLLGGCLLIALYFIIIAS